MPATGNHITDPLNWDWNVCHTYYFLWPGMGNVSNMIWDGDNPATEASTSGWYLLRPGDVLRKLPDRRPPVNRYPA